MSKKVPDPVFVLRGALSPITSLHYIQPRDEDENLQYLASGTQDGDAILWDMKIRNQYSAWKCHNSSVLWIKYLSEENFWTEGRNDKVLLWDISGSSPREKVKFLLDNYLGFSCADVSPLDQSLLCTPGPAQENVSVWDVKSGLKICVLKPFNEKWGTVMQCQWLEWQNNLYLLVAYENGILALWNWANGKVISELNFDGNPVSIMFDSQMKKGVCGTATEKLIVFGLDERGLLFKDKDFTVTNPGIGAICSRPDHKMYATGGWDFRLRLFNWKSHKPLAVLQYHKKSIQSLAFSQKPVESFNPRGFLLASGSSDNSISLWDIYN